MIKMMNMLHMNMNAMMDISALDNRQCHWNSTGNWVTEKVYYLWLNRTLWWEKCSIIDAELQKDSDMHLNQMEYLAMEIDKDPILPERGRHSNYEC